MPEPSSPCHAIHWGRRGRGAWEGKRDTIAVTAGPTGGKAPEPTCSKPSQSCNGLLGTESMHKANAWQQLTPHATYSALSQGQQCAGSWERRMRGMETREASGMKGERALTQDTNHVRCPGPTDSMPRQVTPSRPCSLEACNCAGLGQADRAEPRIQKQPYTGMNTCPRTDRGNHRRPFSKCRWTHIRPRTPGSVSVRGHGSLCSNRPKLETTEMPLRSGTNFFIVAHSHHETVHSGEDDGRQLHETRSDKSHRHNGKQKRLPNRRELYWESLIPNPRKC